MALPFLSYQMLHRLAKFCEIKISFKKCDIDIHSRCYLKQIILQARPLTVTKRRIFYEAPNWALSSRLGSAVPDQDTCVGASWGHGGFCLPDAWTPCPVPKERALTMSLKLFKSARTSTFFCNFLLSNWLRYVQKLYTKALCTHTYVFSTNKCQTLEELGRNWMLTFTVEIPIQEKTEEHWILAKGSNHEVSKAGVRE